MRRIKIDWLKTLAIPNHRVACVKPDNRPAGRIELQDGSEIRGQMRAASNASIRRGEPRSSIKRSARLVKENVADAKKAGPRFGKDAGLTKTFAELDTELALKRAALAKKSKDIFIRKEV